MTTVLSFAVGVWGGGPGGRADDETLTIAAGAAPPLPMASPRSGI